MAEKLDNVTRKVLAHVERARGAIENFRRDGVNVAGVLRNPSIQAAALRVARAELVEAITIVENTRWRGAGERSGQSS